MVYLISHNSCQNFDNVLDAFGFTYSWLNSATIVAYDEHHGCWVETEIRSRLL